MKYILLLIFQFQSFVSIFLWGDSSYFKLSYAAADSQGDIAVIPHKVVKQLMNWALYKQISLQVIYTVW